MRNAASSEAALQNRYYQKNAQIWMTMPATLGRWLS
jgi:hypothetical protein